MIAARAGLADALFEHDGQITKREIRAVTLSVARAATRANCCGTSAPARARSRSSGCWRDPSMRAIAIEARADRAARISRNAAAFGVPGLEIVEGHAPAALDGLAHA